MYTDIGEEIIITTYIKHGHVHYYYNTQHTISSRCCNCRQCMQFDCRPVSLVGRWGGSGNNKGGTKIILFTEIYMIMIEIHGMTNVSNYITQNSWLY